MLLFPLNLCYMRKISLLLVMAIAMSGCGRFGNKNEEQKTANRIVCISKQYSEIIFGLGAQKDIVAVDLSSTYPDAVKKLPTIGYHRALTIEGILAQKPTLILQDNNIGPEHVIGQINELKIPMKAFNSKADDISSTKDLIREIGAYFRKTGPADSLCQLLDRQMEEALSNAKKYRDTPTVLIVHFGQASNTYLVMTRKNIAAKMVAWAGGRITIEGEKGMMPLSAETIAQSNPDVILLTDFGYDRLGTNKKISELPGIANTSAARNSRIFRIEEHDLVYLGPRTGANTLLIQKLIHNY